MLNGKSLRDMRGVVGITQTELAKKSGIDRSRLSTAENGHVQLSSEELATIQRVLSSTAQQKAKQLEKLIGMAG